MEEVKDAKKGYEEYQTYLNGGYKEQEDLEEAVARDTKYERYVKIFAHVILAIGIIYAAYNLYNIFEWASQADDYLSQISGLNSVQRGAAMGLALVVKSATS